MMIDHTISQDSQRKPTCFVEQEIPLLRSNQGAASTSPGSVMEPESDETSERSRRLAALHAGSKPCERLQCQHGWSINGAS
eukprot:3071282-Amphidinium_carterae.2